MSLFKKEADETLIALIAEREAWREKMVSIKDKNTEEYANAFQTWINVSDEVQKYEDTHKQWWQKINWINVITAMSGLVTAGVGVASAINTKNAIEESRYEAELAYRNDQNDQLCDGRVWNQKNNLNKFIK